MLTEEQIQSLFIFCEKHFVKYYDVQVELVDHLANAIEAKMDADPPLPFEKALNEVHESFGVRGFAVLVFEKQKAAEIASRKLFWKLFKDQFRWPKVLEFVLLTIVMLSIFLNDILIFRWVFISILFTGCVIEIYSVFRIRILLKHSGKKFLLGEFTQFFQLIWFPFYVFYLPFILDKNFLVTIHSATSILFCSIILSMYIICIIAVLRTISLAKKELHKQYPEVFTLTW